MHDGTYSWKQDGEDSLIELTEWVNVPGYHPSQPIVPKWIYLRKSNEYLSLRPFKSFPVHSGGNFFRTIFIGSEKPASGRALGEDFFISDHLVA